MPFATICASHTPLLHDGVASPATRQRVRDAFDAMARHITAFGPELIVQFSPDHFNGFFYGLMPAFCVGTQATSVGDWDTRPGALPVAAERALELSAQLLADGVDVAVSRRMAVDHGFVQIWEEMFDQEQSYPAPVVPIFVNAAAPPLPTYKRARLLGAAVGRWAAGIGLRTLFAASGGLSHDPPLPDLQTAPDPVREALIAGLPPTVEGMERRKRAVLAAGEKASRGEPPCQPLNPAWDQAMIDRFVARDIGWFDTLDPDVVRRDAGAAPTRCSPGSQPSRPRRPPPTRR